MVKSAAVEKDAIRPPRKRDLIISRPVIDRQEAMESSNMLIVQKGNCRRFEPSLESMAKGVTLLPGAQQRRDAVLYLQRTNGNQFVQRMAKQAKSRSNRTGMPDQLKSGIEALSGMDLSDVQVHYGSSRPVQFQALAYAQGNKIHIGPGQEKHLTHEAWHVVQQKQGRVRPTMQINGVNVSDDRELEKEADDIAGNRQQVESAYHKSLHAKLTAPDSFKTIQFAMTDQEVASEIDKINSGMPILRGNPPSPITVDSISKANDLMKEWGTKYETGFVFVDNRFRKVIKGAEASGAHLASVSIKDLTEGISEENMKKASITHYHPQGLPLSDGDIRALILNHFFSITAAGMYGTFTAGLGLNYSEAFGGSLDTPDRILNLRRNINIGEYEKTAKSNAEKIMMNLSKKHFTAKNRYIPGGIPDIIIDKLGKILMYSYLAGDIAKKGWVILKDDYMNMNMVIRKFLKSDLTDNINGMDIVTDEKRESIAWLDHYDPSIF